MELAVATYPGGLVIEALRSTSYCIPVLSKVCTEPDIAKDIPAFRQRTLSARKRTAAIGHFKTCGPCREALGWGKL